MSLEIREKIILLANDIRRYQKAYYVDNKPKISDREFDKLFQELLDLEKKFPEYSSPNSPTKLIGSDLDNEFQKYQHKIPVLSLENTYSSEELIEWAGKFDEGEIFSFEWKIDGASIVLYYEKGELSRAVTRGTGGIGDDITDNIRTIKNIPLVLHEKIDLIVRGEVYMTYSDFEEFNKENSGKYANPRNLTSGSIKQKNSSLVAQRPLKIGVYDAYLPDKKIKTHKDILKYLGDEHFPIMSDTKFVKISDFKKTIEEFKKKKDKLPYPTDGLVIKLNNLHKRLELGETSHSPRYARALKFEAVLAETIIEEIDFAIGRTGKLTPRAKVKPVRLLGTTVTYATLHNQDFIVEKKIGIGARVKIAKRGEIIPAVEEVIEEPLTIFKIPDICPTCGTKLEKIEESVDTFCTNRTCESRIINNIIFFCQRKQMDIEGLGEKMVEILFKNGFIKSIVGIYDLHLKRDELESLDGMGKKSVSIILEGIEKSKAKDLKTILPSIGFTDLGHKVTEILVENGYTNIEFLWRDLQKPDFQEIFSNFFGLGEKTILSLKNELLDPENIQLIRELQNRGLNFQTEGIKKSDLKIFENQLWCVTGSFEKFTPRDKAMELVEYYGGKKTGTISSKTTHLLVGEGGGSKVEKAGKLGISLVKEKEFLAILEEAGITV